MAFRTGGVWNLAVNIPDHVDLQDDAVVFWRTSCFGGGTLYTQHAEETRFGTKHAIQLIRIFQHNFMRMEEEYSGRIGAAP